MNLMRKIVFFVCLLAMTQCVAAQNSGDTLRVQRLNHQEINFLDNILDGSRNPVRLSFNSVHTLTAATVGAHLERGNFHDVDEGRKHNNLHVNLAGLKRIGKLSLSGDFTYLNAKDYDHKWNNTLMLSRQNPFVLADSVNSIVTLEQFSMHAAASYLFSEKIAAALRLHYMTGGSSDQEDPRPKVSAMRFTVTPGVLFHVGGSHRLGASAEVQVYSSDLSHTLVDNYTPQTYFLMKGMGDHTYFSSNDIASYPREYEGTAYGGHLQWQAFFCTMANMLEIGVRANSEKATDGGSYYTYKAGDFSETCFSLSDRLSFGSGSSLRHDIILNAQLQQGKGDWYDQQRSLDTEHNYRVIYVVLNKSKVHKTQSMSGSISYQLHQLQNGITQWSARVQAALSQSQQKHFEAAVFEQKYTMARLSAEGKKYWPLGRCRLQTGIGAFLRMGLGNLTYASVRDKLALQYVNPAFEYATATVYGGQARAAIDVPVCLYHTPTWVTVFVRGQYAAYGGDNEYTSLFDGESRTMMNFGITLTL